VFDEDAADVSGAAADEDGFPGAGGTAHDRIP
jgi:hypothetical protein